jgi:hypothetical protein
LEEHLVALAELVAIRRIVELVELLLRRILRSATSADT